MEGPAADGFHKVKGVKITHGVPSREGGFRTSEKVSIRLPAIVIGEKSAINLLVDPGEYSQTSHQPGIVYVNGSTFWLYKETVFVDSQRRKNAEIKTLADRLLLGGVRS